MANEKNAATETTGTRGRKSDRPITERVFEQWQRAHNAKRSFDNHAGKLARLSQQLTDEQVAEVNEMREKFLAGGGDESVESKIEI